MSAPKKLDPAQKKGAPPRLTLCPSPNLDWSRDGTPASQDFDDIYFSVEDGLAETRAVYLKACGLPERWAEDGFTRGGFVIGELGFGTGLNFLATWQMWEQHKSAKGRLHFVSVEKFPLSTEMLRKALSSWSDNSPELGPYIAKLIAAWPDRVRGTHILRLSDDVTLTLIHDDVQAALSGLSMQADAWFLDGFTPAKNPAMWTKEVMAHVVRLSKGGARVGTFTAAGAVRQALSEAGFDVRKTDGFGRKRHRIEAVMPVRETSPQPEVRPIIIGAGIAGCTLYEAFTRRGIAVTIIDSGDNTAASGNVAAIVKPRLDRNDSPLARFALSSFLYATRFYDSLDAVISEGVDHAPQTPEQVARHADLAKLPALSSEQMQWTGEIMRFPRAQVIDPQKAKQGLLGGCENVKATAKAVSRDGTGLSVLGENGEVIARGTHIIFAAGAGVRDVEMFDELELRYARGQINWAKNDGLETALTYGGYAVPLGDELLLGATHDRLEEGTNPYQTREADDVRNQQGYLAATGQMLTPSKRPSRASIRVNSKTTWPFIAQLEEGVVAFTGLGSRGFVFAPLMAEMLAADMLNEPVVWPPKLKR